MASKEYKLAIKIAGEIEKSFYSSTKLTKKELNNIARSAADSAYGMRNSFSGSFDDATKGFTALGKTAEKAFKAAEKGAVLAATAVAAITAASVTAGIGFESAFAGVKKTTDATTAEYADLREAILDMANDIPATADAISGVAEVAGQLGVEKDNLIDFSRVMIDLGESTNLTAEQAATSLAKFANITGLAADKYSNLGSVIVALGNNFATTEADIVEMGTRMAASGELAGLSESQIMALSTAMSSVGIEAEAGGSAMSKLLKNIQVSVETGNGMLEDFASVAGKSTKEFSELFKTDAVGALAAFIDGLNDTERNGKSATVILDDMELTEVRLSNTILSLANSNGLMTKAVDMASQAWTENTALSIEAGKRYETTASKISMLKNRVTGVGIEIYDGLSEPLRESIDVASDFTESIADNMVPELMTSFNSKLPTVIRKTKEFGKAFANFAEPVIDLGGWMVKNPNVISSSLIAIGSGIATYKVATGIMSVGKAISALSLIATNPVALAITGVALAIGGAAGIAAYVSKANNELKKQNLAKHFGDINLSIEELGDVAKYVIKNDNLGKLAEALGSFEDIEQLAGSVDEAITEINKMNWKVSIGMQLTDEDKDSYTSSIASFISDTQAMVLQSQYAIGLNLQVLTDDDAEGTAIRNGFDAFYSKNYKELQDMGTNLQSAVNKAFEDGLLTIDEVKEITELQKQMAAITEKMAQSKFESQLDVLGVKYSGGNLDPETFQNLQDQIATQVDAAVASYDESLQISIASAKVRLSEGDIDLTEYNNIVGELKENYLEQIGEVELKASSFQVNTIMDQYAAELDKAIPGFTEKMQSLVGESMDQLTWDDRSVLIFDSLYEDLSKNTELDKGTKKAITELFTKMQPTVEQLSALEAKYKDAGMAIPASLSKGLNDIASIGALTGDYNSIWTLIGSEASSSEAYKKTIADLQAKGSYVPESIQEAIDQQKNVLTDVAKDTKDTFGQSLQQEFAKGFDLTAKLNIRSQFNAIKDSPLGSKSKIPGYASGGIITSPTLATFAEKVPEAAIPLDGSSNAVNLWKTAGKILGVYADKKSTSGGFASFNSGDSSFSSLADKVQGQGGGIGDIHYNPEFHFHGDAPSKEDLLDATRISQEEFNAKMERWMSQNRRLKFS